jgi:hypothetical protein
LIQANWNERKEKSPWSIDKPGIRTEEANSREKATVEDNVIVLQALPLVPAASILPTV